MRKILIAASGFMSMLLLAGASSASAVQGIGVTPALQEVVLDAAAASVDFEVGVTNTTDHTVTLKLTTLDFGSLDESGGLAFIGRGGQETNFSLSRWMKLSAETVTLSPNQSQAVRVTVVNESSLSPGGHYGAVIVSGDGQAQGTDSVAVLPAASSLVFLRKTGGERHDLKMQSFFANKSLFSLPKSFIHTFANDGNVHLVPRGIIELKSTFGKVIARGVMNETSAFVLPETRRQFTTELSAFSQPWLPGRYTLETQWRYDGEAVMRTEVYHMWFVGKLTVLLVAVACTVLVLFLYIRARRRPPVRGL